MNIWPVRVLSCLGTSAIKKAMVGYLLVLQVMAVPGLLAWTLDVVRLGQHYRDHCLEEGRVGLDDFIALHYGDLQGEHAQAHDHSDLPFKSQHIPDYVLPGILMLMLGQQDWAIQAPDVPNAGELVVREDMWYSRLPFFDIWQPPQVG